MLASTGLVGPVARQLRRRIDDPMLENVAILVTPFAAFLRAEAAHASGGWRWSCAGR